MPLKNNLSLAERKQKLMEECAACAAGGGGMSVGTNGFEGSADPAGPNAGFDPLLKTLKRLRKGKKTVKLKPGERHTSDFL